MRTIWKYEVQGDDVIEVPAGAKVLSAQMQGMKLCVWFQVDSLNSPQKRTVQVFPTGVAPLPTELGEYAGTVQIASGALIYHVFVL